MCAAGATTTLLLTMLSSLALASEGAAAEDVHPVGSGRILVLVVMVALTYLAAHFVVNRLQRRWLFISGLEYILLGVLLGPTVVNTLAVFDDLARLAPIIAFAAGWIGLLYGMDFGLRRMLKEDYGTALRLAFAEVAGTGTATCLGAFAFFRSGWLLPEVPTTDAWSAAFALGCAAAAGSSSAIDLISDSYPRLESRLLPVLKRTARLGDLFAILAFGLLFCLFHTGGGDGSNAMLAPRPGDWVLITVGLGLGLGLLFAVFLGNEPTENSRFLALVGIIVFAAGSSFFLNIGALTVNLLLGVVLVNSSDGKEVAKTLQSSLKPVTLMLMVFAGAMWHPENWGAAAVFAVLYIVVRAASKALSLFLASIGTPLRGDLFRGVMAQGDVAVAIAVSYRIVYEGPAADLVYTAILVSVVVHELVSPRILKGLLIDAGELDSDAPAWAGGR